MIEEAESRNCNIDMKNYKTKKDPYMRYDDNVVDSRAICDFVFEVNNKLDEYRNIVEFSFEI